MSEPEVCSKCGQPKPIALCLQHPDGKKDLLCQVCANRWLLSDEEWPPESEQKEDKPSSQTSYNST